MRRLLLPLVLAATPALASSEDAWRKFREAVLKSCETAVAGRLETPAIAVDPFGSDSYGVAIARGTSTDAKAPRAIVCVYDKRRKSVETSGEFVP
ncbi:MAG: hypothetical protein ACR652_12075 [Methylocystis sp.]|uniref:hypothetical protein n=1 Tax=Methylocystis sp. TaxID=1911079 RepID=UPI003DA5EEE4